MIGPACHAHGIRGNGAENADIMVIGISPGSDEVREGKPFVGKSGQLLDSVLRSVGIERKDIYTTNILCWKKEDPSLEDQLRCRKRLLEEISFIKPRIIYLLGAVPTNAFLGRKLGGKNGACGAVEWDSRFDAYLIPTYHPAAIFHAMNDRSVKDNTYIYDLFRDFNKASAVLEWAPGAPLAKVEYRVVQTIADFQNVLNWLPTTEPVALDVETLNKEVEELDVWTDELLCFSIATKDYGWVVPFELIEELKIQGVTWPDVQWTFHNAQFDTQIIKKNLDVWLEVHEDTMLQSYSLDERGGIHGLKPLARGYLGAGWWEEAREKGKKKLQDLPREVLYEYNAKDAIYTARLSYLFRARQEQDDVRNMYERILIPSVNAIKEIQYNGIRINKKMHYKFSIEWGQLYLALEEEIQELAFEAGWPNKEINLQSPQQVSKLLFNILSLPTGKKSKKTGDPSSDSEELKKLRGFHPIVDKILEFRHVARYYDTYITGLGKHIKEDGRVHPYCKIHGARTGRWSYGDPPVQTIPQTYQVEGVDSEFRRIRELFTTRSRNHVMLEVDYGKGEIWCGQALSGDPQMLEDLTSGDYHSVVAADVLNKSIDEVTKENRLLMKHVTFGVMYWTEPRTLSGMLKSSMLEAQIYINNWFRRNHVYRDWFDEIVRIVKEKGELVSVTGRKRRFFILNEGVRELKQAVNFPIQGALGDMTELALIILHSEFKKRGWDARVLLQVHDSLLFEVHKDILPEVSVLVHEVMTSVMHKGFPRLPVEMSAGKNWGKTKPFFDCTVDHYYNINKHKVVDREDTCFGNDHSITSDMLRNRMYNLGILDVEARSVHQELSTAS